MSTSDELFERVANAPAVPPGLPLIVLLTGFTDAGSAVSQLLGHLEETTDPQPLVIFDNDRLLDYRARRPIVHFDQDHLTSYAPAKLELALAHDAIGQPFLLLSGYEPDFAWNAFVEAVLDLVEAYGASGMTWAHAIAMPVPHTRPLGVTVSGNRAELIAAHTVWKPRTQVPSTAGHLLEYRLAERGDDVIGFVLLVPHYLADTAYPGAAVTAAQRLMDATGRVLDVDELLGENDDYLSRVQEQVQASEELQQMLRTLEERYDAYMAGFHSPDGDGGGFGEAHLSERNLPSADELAAELERYLATRFPGEDEGKPA